MHDGVLGAADIQFSASSIGVDVGSAARLGPLPAEARIPEQRSPVVQQNMYVHQCCKVPQVPKTWVNPGKHQRVKR